LLEIFFEGFFLYTISTNINFSFNLYQLDGI
jgi:hypothetical protein